MLFAPASGAEGDPGGRNGHPDSSCGRPRQDHFGRRFAAARRFRPGHL